MQENLSKKNREELCWVWNNNQQQYAATPEFPPTFAVCGERHVIGRLDSLICSHALLLLQQLPNFELIPPPPYSTQESL
jgi:hypothetical protein